MIYGGKVRIGVLGGIGPEATANFYSKLIRKLQSEGFVKSNSDFPQIIINSIPAPELVGKISEENLDIYVKGLKELDDIGIDFIVMVCNTIHIYYERLQKEVAAPIINLPKEVEFFLRKNKVSSIFVIGTQETINGELYKFKGINYSAPNANDISILSKIIFDFNMGVDKNLQITKVKNICLKYLANKDCAVILGCTEFCTMLEDETFNKINTIDVLVNSVIKTFLEMIK